MAFLIALLACGTLREGGGTAVGNPSKTAIRLAPMGLTPWDSATASLDLILVSCDGSDPWREGLGVTDLLSGPVVAIPAGSWCSLELEVRELQASGDTQVSVAQALLVLDVADVTFEGGDLVLELGEPASPDGLERKSALYAEVVVDRRLDSIERSAGSLAAGPERTPDPEEPTVMLVVGSDGFRSPQLAEAGDYDVEDGGEAFLSVAHNDGLWVAVGSYTGTRSAASIDHGQSWTQGDLEAPARSVHFHDGEFIAPSATGRISVTEDGISWTEIHSAGVSLAAAFSGPSRTVVVGTEVVLFADDARTWTRVDLPTAGQFRDVTWAPAGFVAVGEEGTIWHSADGETWTDRTPGTTDLDAVVWSGTRFVTVGDSESWVSEDGLSWTAGEEKSFNDVEVHEGGLYAVTGAFIFRSLDDGLSWEAWRTVDVQWMAGIGSNTP